MTKSFWSLKLAVYKSFNHDSIGEYCLRFFPKEDSNVYVVFT